MTQNIEYVPKGTVIEIGPKAGEFVIRTEPHKHYTRRYGSHRSKPFKARRGAYLRFVENQSAVS